MRRRILSVLLTCSLLFTGCASTNNNTSIEPKTVQTSEKVEMIIPEDELVDDSKYEYVADFEDMDDQALLTYVEASVYNEVVSGLNSDKYYVENVNVKYISKEYLEELSYNSQSNIFFGYTLEDIEAVYGDSKYVFTLGENGETTVQPFEGYDDTYEQIIKNVVIGTGVILVSVTVSVVTAGTGTPAVSVIFAASAKTGTIMALSSGTLGGVATGIVTAGQTGDINQAIKAGTLEASESFKWGAITGTIAGGTSETLKYGKAMKALKGADLNITTQEAAAIQMQTGYPVEVISQFHSMEEFEVFKNASLKTAMVNGQNALVRSDIDFKYVDEWGRTNMERMEGGLCPLDANGNYYELHHIGQEADATLAILTKHEHDNAVLHGFKTISEINRNAFTKQKKKFWKSMAQLYESGVI